MIVAYREEHYIQQFLVTLTRPAPEDSRNYSSLSKTSIYLNIDKFLSC